MNPSRENSLQADKATAANPQANAPARISPLYNEVFLKTFGESKASAKALANSVLRYFGIDEIDTVKSIKSDAVEPGAVGLKSSRCDVVLVADEKVIDLEAQRRKINYDNKALFYAAKLLVSNTMKGENYDYEKLPQVIVIMLIEGHKMFKGDQFATICRMAWEHESGTSPGSDRVTLIAIELDKVAEAYNKGITEEVLSDELNAWLYVLARGYRDQKEVDELIKGVSVG